MAKPHEQSGEYGVQKAVERERAPSYISSHLKPLLVQDSSIIDFYPDDFAIDLNGKKYAWQGESASPPVTFPAVFSQFPADTPVSDQSSLTLIPLMFSGRFLFLWFFLKAWPCYRLWMNVG